MLTSGSTLAFLVYAWRTKTLVLVCFWPFCSCTHSFDHFALLLHAWPLFDFDMARRLIGLFENMFDLYCARPFHTCTCWNFCHATLFIVNVLCCSAIFAWICFVPLCCALSRAGLCGYSSVAIWLAWQCTRVHVCTCSHQTSCPCPCIEIYVVSLVVFTVYHCEYHKLSRHRLLVL